MYSKSDHLMSSELLTIFNRLKERIDTGKDNFNVLNDILIKKSEIEDKISELYKTIIPVKYDNNDPILSSIIEEIRNESNIHSKYAASIRSQIIVPNSRYSQTLREKHSTLSSLIKNNQNNLIKFQNDFEKSQKDLEIERSKLNNLPPNKKSSQEANINKQIGVVKSKQDILDKEILKLRQSSIASLHGEFSDFDSTRLTKMQLYSRTLINMNSQVHEAIEDISKKLLVKLDNFDGNDRSLRFVDKAFDPHSTSIDENQILIGFALEDFQSEDPGDLKFIRGDKITILVQHQSGWWEGEVNGKKGLFPKTFISFTNKDKVVNVPIGAVFLCIKDHVGSIGGDISILSGDLDYVDYIIKEKCSGRNLRNNKRGYFPLSILEKTI